MPDDIKDRVVARIKKLSKDYTKVANNDQYAGWIAAVQHAVDVACGAHGSAYRKQMDLLQKRFMNSRSNFDRSEVGSDVRALLSHLLDEIENGLLISIADQVTAENFDNFLDHGEAYLKKAQKNEAGVIVGIVFEDTLRRICRNAGISEAGKKLDGLISALVNQNVLTPLKAKRARAAAGLRTSAAHAQWDKFELSDIQPALDLTRELIEIHLDEGATAP